MEGKNIVLTHISIKGLYIEYRKNSWMIRKRQNPKKWLTDLKWCFTNDIQLNIKIWNGPIALVIRRMQIETRDTNTYFLRIVKINKIVNIRWYGAITTIILCSCEWQLIKNLLGKLAFSVKGNMILEVYY